MSRQSSDEIRDGAVYNGFDYHLQVWVLNGVVQQCGHRGHCGCPAAQYHGEMVAEIPGHEIREERVRQTKR